MKRISVGLILAMSLTFSVQANAERKAEKSLGKILKCTRKIVEQNRGGDNGLKFAGRVLEDASIEKNNPEALKNISRVCNKFKRKQVKSSFIDRKSIDEKIGALEVSESTKEILKPFNTPYYECKFRNVEAHIAIGIGVGAGLGAAKCEGTNGRRYILLIPQLNFNMGFIAGVFSRGAEIDDDNRLIGLATDEGYLAAGYFLGGLFDGGAELDQIGTGVGLGVAMGISGQLRLKAIPLRNKFDSLIETM